MPKSLRAPLIALGIMLLAAVSNPSPERHRQRIRAAIAERSPLEGALGVGALAAFASSYHSLGIASYTEAGGRTLSYGAFGMVFVADE